jgi:hypothetical protein
MSASYEQLVTGEIILAGISNYAGAQTVYVLLRDGANDILLCTGLTKPTDGEPGFSKGCLFIDTDVAAATSGLFVNIGTNLLCSFKLVSNA